MAFIAIHPVRSASADGICYAQADADADALLRYQARQRTVGLLCHSSDGKNLFQDYQLFTVSNASAIAKADARIEHWHGDEDASHEAETQMQNAEALSAAILGNRSYCRQYAAGLEEAELESPAELKRAVEKFRLVEPGPVKLCHQP